jgi:hypothetical protein
MLYPLSYGGQRPVPLLGTAHHPGTTLRVLWSPPWSGPETSPTNPHPSAFVRSSFPGAGGELATAPADLLPESDAAPTAGG